MKLARFLLAGLALSAASPVLAATTPRPIPGYKCMMLDLTEQQSMDPSVHIQVRSGPSNSAPAIGWASSVVVVKQPATPVGGYLEMLFSNGREAWIAAKQVRPFKSVSAPSAQCFPVILSNGLVGISSK